MKIGILSLQGAIEEHERSTRDAAEKLGIELELTRVILPSEIEDIDGLIMPGGESSAMILIGKKNGMLDAVKQKIDDGLPVFGTCAGAILMSKRVRRVTGTEMKEGAFPYLEIEILRNGYGRQVDSFSTQMEVDFLDSPTEGVFIRAPKIESHDENVEILSTVRGDPVLVRQGNLLAATCHPELTDDSRIHQEFLKMILVRKNK